MPDGGEMFPHSFNAVVVCELCDRTDSLRIPNSLRDDLDPPNISNCFFYKPLLNFRDTTQVA